MLGADARIVEAGSHGVHGSGLSLLVEEDVRVEAVDLARNASGEGGRVRAQTELQPLPRGFHARDGDLGIVQESREEADGVASAADACGHLVGKPAFPFEHLCPGLPSDDALEVAHDFRIRRRSDDGAEEIESLQVVHPRHERAVHGLLERRLAVVYRDDFRAQRLHPGDVRRLTLDVDSPHVHRALHPHQGRRRRARRAVHSRARLGDETLLSHTLRQQRLSERVVDLVRAGVVQILPLQEKASPAALLREVDTLRDRRRPAYVLDEQRVQLFLKRAVRHRVVEGPLQHCQQLRDPLRHEPSAVLPVIPPLCLSVVCLRHFDLLLRSCEDALR